MNIKSVTNHTCGKWPGKKGQEDRQQSGKHTYKKS